VGQHLSEHLWTNDTDTPHIVTSVSGTGHKFEASQIYTPSGKAYNLERKLRAATSEAEQQAIISQAKADGTIATKGTTFVRGRDGKYKELGGGIWGSVAVLEEPLTKGGVGSGRKPSVRTTLPQALDRIDRVADKADAVGHTWYASGLSAKALMKAAELHSQLAQLHRAVGRRDGDSAYHSAYHSDAAAANAAASRALAGLARRVESGTAKKEHFYRVEELAQRALSETAAAIRHSK